MIAEERVMAIFVEANPAPDVDDLRLIEVGSAVYLANLEQRSSEVTTLDTKQDRDTKRTPPIIPWLVAAGVILVIAVALILKSQGAEEPPVLTTPVSTTVPTEPDLGQLEGTWSSGNLTLILGAGTYELKVGANTFDRGTFRADPGGQISFQTTNSSTCGNGSAMSYVFEISGADALTLQLADGVDDCPPRRANMGAAPVFTSASPAEPTRDPDLLGIWAGDGFNLVFGEGTYEMTVDGAAFDRGTYSFTGFPNAIDLVSSQESASCAEGDRRGVSYSIQPGESLTISAGGDQCLARLNTMHEEDVLTLGS